MTEKFISATIKRRLSQSSICPICEKEISEYDDFQYIAFKRSRNIIYRFFHTKCLVNQQSDIGERGEP